MAKRGQLIVKVGVDGVGFQKGLDDLSKRLTKFAIRMSGPIGFGALVKRGIEFNRTLETAQVGIAAILRQFQPRRFASTADALGKAGEIMAEIKEQAMTTVDTIRDLTTAYKNLAGVMFQANVPVEKQAKLITLMSQAVRGMGLGARGQQMFQLIEETRAILTGQVTRYSIVAQQLVAKAPGGIDALREAIRTGKAYEFILKHMIGFKEAGDLLNKTLEGAISNLNDIIDTVVGYGTQGLFDQLKVWIIDLQNLLLDPAFKTGMREFVDGLTEVAKTSVKVGSATAKKAYENRGWLVPTGEVIAGVWVIDKVFALIVRFAGFLKGVGGFLVSLLARLAGMGLTGAKFVGRGLGSAAFRAAGSHPITAVAATAALPLVSAYGEMLPAFNAAASNAEQTQSGISRLFAAKQARKLREWKDSRANMLLTRGALTGELKDLSLLGTGETGLIRALEMLDQFNDKMEETGTALYKTLPALRSLMTTEEEMISLRRERLALEKAGIDASNVQQWVGIRVAETKLARQANKGMMGGIMSGVGFGGNAYTRRGLFTSRSQMTYQASVQGILESSRDLLKEILTKIQGPDPLGNPI